MKNYKLIYAVLIAALFLSGCNDGGSEVSVDDNDTNFVADTPVTVYAKDDYEFVQTEPSSQYYINLEDSVDLSGRADIKIDKLTLISGDSSCQLISQDEHGFTVSTNSTAVCDYQYSLTSSDSTQLEGKTQALSRVVISEDPEQSELVPFGMTAYQDQTTTIDIATELNKVGDTTDLDGYTLSENVVITSDSSGSTAIADPTTNSIEYTPGDGFTGIEEILYSMSNDAGAVLAGSIVITVSPETSQGIQIQKKIVIDEGVQVNEMATIDLSEYVTADPADDWQLIYVSNFGAQVELKDKNDLQNKAFTFLADRAGDYYVNAVVTDHHGGFDTSLIQILVADPAAARDWSYIVNGLNVFSAPLTKTDADSESVNYDGANYDSGVGLSVASFSYTSAKAYCNSFGQLPTQEELTNMNNAQNPEVQGWPMGLPYWTSDPNTLYNLKNGDVTEPEGTKPYYVTCISTGEFSINSAESVTQAVADGVDEAKVVAYLTINGQPVPNQTVDATLPDGKQASVQSPQVSDEQGRVEFTLTDLKAEDVNVTLTYKGVAHSLKVTFVADKSTAGITAETTVDNSDEDEVTATLKDANNNPIAGETVKFTADDETKVNLSVNDITTDSQGQQSVKVTWIGDVSASQKSSEITARYTLPDETKVSDTSTVNFTTYKLGEYEAIVDYGNLYHGFDEFRIKVVDENGVGQPGRSVTLTSPDPHFWLADDTYTPGAGQPLTVTSDAEGWASFRVVSMNDLDTIPQYDDPLLYIVLAQLGGGTAQPIEMHFIYKGFQQIEIGTNSLASCADKGFEEIDVDEFVEVMNSSHPYDVSDLRYVSCGDGTVQCYGHTTNRYEDSENSQRPYIYQDVAAYWTNEKQWQHSATMADDSLLCSKVSTNTKYKLR